ncbi:uncharacterized protein METZ01_LOCUS436037, partial [marine metagenome]
VINDIANRNDSQRITGGPLTVDPQQLLD